MTDWRSSVGASIDEIERRFGPVRGCTTAEMEELEALAGGPLPAAYRYFLERVGAGAEDFMRGSEFDIVFLRSRTNADYDEVLAEDGVEPLPSNAYVFFDHQGYQFYWFSRTSEPDPEVFHYTTTRRTQMKVAASFSEWLALCVESAVTVRGTTNLGEDREGRGDGKR